MLNFNRKKNTKQNQDGRATFTNLKKIQHNNHMIVIQMILDNLLYDHTLQN